MKKILEIDPSNDQARKTIRRLETLAAEKREKMIGEFFFLSFSCFLIFIVFLCGGASAFFLCLTCIIIIIILCLFFAYQLALATKLDGLIP